MHASGVGSRQREAPTQPPKCKVTGNLDVRRSRASHLIVLRLKIHHVAAQHREGGKHCLLLAPLSADSAASPETRAGIIPRRSMLCYIYWFENRPVDAMVSHLAALIWCTRRSIIKVYKT
ncbi:hypothetical protein KQH60_12490 [Mycetohabitans sp. B8]|uniref:hypothetical protein n=1 Tax=Mycetohabitans sp. B8 TaxID=2841845 RepID=UPI001F1F1652|nr:hypothetical protein [Mycetohabitans sp. B8]MCG1043312.1 hypothetical protein [Mycetohabitans sp. B8]